MARIALEAPTLADVTAARDRIRAYLPATPLRNYPSLDRLTGAEVWVKHDNLLPTGAFKVRGGVNLISQMDAATRARGVIAASTGNHGQSVAFASRIFGVRATVVAPEGANPVKVDANRVRAASAHPARAARRLRADGRRVDPGRGRDHDREDAHPRGAGRGRTARGAPVARAPRPPSGQARRAHLLRGKHQPRAAASAAGASLAAYSGV